MNTNKEINDDSTNHILKYTTTIDGAILPKHKMNGDVGIDINALKMVKKYGERTFMYDTGICIQPPEGYYTTLIPRSSIIKSGYLQSNSIGILDSGYRGSIRVVLTKVDDSLPDLEPPFTITQLILQKSEKCDPLFVTELYDTTRGDGGFGSTDKYK